MVERILPLASERWRVPLPICIRAGAGNYIAASMISPATPHFELRGEFFNAFNHAQFNNPDAGASDVNFGVISSAKAPRLIKYRAG